LAAEGEGRGDAEAAGAPGTDAAKGSEVKRGELKVGEVVAYCLLKRLLGIEA
jgi:hypothetical protein